jgi:sugar phosphate isomerase/epimerase
MKISRRHLLVASAAPMFAAPKRKLAICSETFAGMSFADACQAARRVGYAGIEIKPAHLDPDPASLSASKRREIRDTIAACGLSCPGLHALLDSPAGMHLTAPSEATRRKSWEYFARLVDLAADIADRPVLVLGSSKQRAAVDGATPNEAADRLKEGLHKLAPHAESRGACILMEPLAPHLCNVINTLEEAMVVVRAVSSPGVQTIFDTHNTAGEKAPPVDLLHRYFQWIRHVHLNEMDGKRPGAGNYDFAPVFRTLEELGYKGWLSVEAFDFKPDGETVARQAFEYLNSL